MALTLLLGFSAVNTGNNLIFLVVSGLLAFMCVTGLAGMVNLQRLSPEIVPPPEIYANTPVLIRVRLRNGKRFLPSFLIRLTCADSQSLTVPIVAAGGSAETTIRISFRERGLGSVGIITVSSIFPVNFFNRYWSFNLAEPLVVFPRLLPGRLGGEGDRLRPGGHHPERRTGLDGELEGIRGYSGRESLRLVHWKLSARSDELLVKEFAASFAAPLIVDPDSFPGTLEERLSRAAWLIKQHHNNRPLGLKLPDSLIPPESGLPHARRLLTELALYGRARQ